MMASTPSAMRTPDRSVSRVQSLVWLALFAGAVAMLGGSARFDAVQMAALRPITALFLVPALYWISRERIDDARGLPLLLGLLAAWTALQLVPLPGALWQALPGRDLIAQLDAANGLEGVWRPISLEPMRSWNALFGLVLPITAVLLLLAMRPSVTNVLLIIVAIGALDAALGLLQILGPPDGALYFYTFTNTGSPVGLFANENHSAFFSAMVLVIIARLLVTLRDPGRRVPMVLGLCAAFVLVTFAVLVSGSRAGLGLGIVAFGASGLMAWLRFRSSRTGRVRRENATFLDRWPRLTLAAGFIVLAGLLFALTQFERAPGVVDAMNQDAFEDLRWEIVPILGEMIRTYWLLGTGFGSFDAVYMIYEPTALQGPAYLNQAHNDWAQWIIEGGLPAVLILVALLRWLVVTFRQLYATSAQPAVMCLFYITVFAMIAVASVFDYPLRTPIVQVVAVWLLITLAREARQKSHSNGMK